MYPRILEGHFDSVFIVGIEQLIEVSLARVLGRQISHKVLSIKSQTPTKTFDHSHVVLNLSFQHNWVITLLKTDTATGHDLGHPKCMYMLVFHPMY